jgi:cytidine deaminase
LGRGGISKLAHVTIPSDLLEVARAARANAHAPYSGFRVGAAIRLSDGVIFGGCNVENASYGATICAERGAICAAVEAQGAIEISEIVVISDGSPPWPPCGICRQVIAEFAASNCRIFCANERGEMFEQTFEALFPKAFSAVDLSGE